MIVGSEPRTHNEKEVNADDENNFFLVFHRILSRFIGIHLIKFIKFYNYCKIIR